MEIIKAQMQDLPEIWEIIESCTKHLQSRGINQWDETYPDLGIIKEDVENGYAYIGRDSDECIAYVALNEKFDDEDPECRRVNWSSSGEKALYIHRLAVHPERQGKGIAKKMLRFIEDLAAKNNYSSIRLEAYSANEAAIKLYENSGYTKAGETYYSFMELPFYCFEKNI